MQSVVPFVNGRCYFKETLEIFDQLLKVFRLKREKNATEGRARTLTDLFFFNAGCFFLQAFKIFFPLKSVCRIFLLKLPVPQPPLKSQMVGP